MSSTEKSELFQVGDEVIGSFRCASCDLLVDLAAQNDGILVLGLCHCAAQRSGAGCRRLARGQARRGGRGTPASARSSAMWAARTGAGQAPPGRQPGAAHEPGGDERRAGGEQRQRHRQPGDQAQHRGRGGSGAPTPRGEPHGAGRPPAVAG